MKRSLLFGISTSVLVVTLVLAMNARTIGSVALAIVTCATTTPCTEGNNTSTGPGLLGQSKSGHGVVGNTLFGSTNNTNGESAVFGQDLSTAGVYDMGVQGTSVRGYGVRGRSTSNSAVRGDSTSGAGVYGVSSSNYGVYGQGFYGFYGNASGYGVVALSSSYGVYSSGTALGVLASSSGGDAIDASTSATSHWAINAQSPNGSGLQVSGGSRGSDTTGGSIGVVARSTNFPLVAALPNGTDLFWIDNAGGGHFTGNIYCKNCPAPEAATTAASYTRATAPAIEETGTARLVYGVANVYLSPSLARSLDPRLGYQVFLTPGGDTRGLYVANKYTGGFTVREVQGGRGTFNFDYHVYARSEEPANAATASARPVLPALTPLTIKAPPLPAQTRP